MTEVIFNPNPTNDSQVVHLAGTETVPGAKTLTSLANFNAGALLGGGGANTGILSASTGSINLILNGNGGSGNVLFNHLTGSGAVYFYDGSTNNIAIIDATGLGTFNGGLMSLNIQFQNSTYPNGVMGVASAATNILSDTAAGDMAVRAPNGKRILFGPNGGSSVASIDATGLGTFNGGLSIADAKDVALATTTGTKIGTATGQKLAFHNSTPVIQRAGAAQVAAATTAATNTTPYGFTTAAQANAIVILVNELRAAAVEKGLIKGAA